ncbi:MAG: glutamate mutase L, partial [Thermoguttaceae bacterium]|nr:glutamate mutase L [Thermoguttaceae bacterium]
MFDVVAGQYRFVARGAVPSLAHPHSTLVDDATAAALDIERATGRVLFVHGHPAIPETQDGSGVDAVLAVCQPDGALRVAVVGATNELAYDSGPRAVSGAGQEVVFNLPLDRQDLRTREGVYESVRRLRDSAPDVILIAGKPAGSSDDQVQIVADALAAVDPPPTSRAPALLFAGDGDQLAAVRRTVGEKMALYGAPPLRPSPAEENLEEAKAILADLHCQTWCAQLPRFDRFAGWLKARPIARDVALARMFRFLGVVEGGAVWGLDLDRATVGIFLAGPSSFSTFRFRPASPPLADAYKWLPIDRSYSVFEQSMVNALLRPTTVPAGVDDVLCEGALLRAMCRQVFEDPRRAVVEPSLGGKPALVVGTGPCTAHVPSNAEAALLLLDCAQPSALGHLCWDALSLLAPIGALASVEPQAAAELALSEAWDRIGFFISPGGSLRTGATGLQIDVQYDDKSSARLEVPAGSLDVLTVPQGERCALAIRMADRFDLGSDWGRKPRVDVEGSPLGVVVDARGRPLTWPTEDQARWRAW